MIRFIDNQLNRITMYRLVLYYLIALLVLRSSSVLPTRLLILLRWR